MDSKKAKRKAKKVKPEDRESEAFKYLDKATKNQKEAAEQIGTTIKEANNSFRAAINNAEDKDKAKVIQVVQNVNNLLAEARKGGDINKIIAKLNKLR